MTFGTYPDVTLKEAQEKPVEAKRILREGEDPGSSVRETRQP
ncbi:MAG: Arm DNA-binding domain-containing protein [Deltaproteobacteria bacterium]|nr:Arm DNA-binding domain-containing protein [Deltaproteobacteria bacterium]